MSAKHLLGALLLVFSAQSYAQGRNPSGEEAFYRVDLNRDRTSSLISKGEMKVRVEARALQAEEEYLVRLDYKIDTYVNGRNEGTEYMRLPAKYFSEQFLVDLRRDGYYETPEFKVRHLGFGNARNMDGREYYDCDVLYFYDINSLNFESVAMQYIEPKMDDAKITALIKYGAPVLGAVRLDMSGKYKGSSMKAGADYLP